MLQSLLGMVPASLVNDCVTFTISQLVPGKAWKHRFMGYYMVGATTECHNGMPHFQQVTGCLRHQIFCLTNKEFPGTITWPF